MLTIEAVQEAIPLTQSFSEQGIILNPVKGSPLEELVKQTVVIFDNDNIDAQASATATNVIDQKMNGSNHDVVMDETVQVISEKIKAHVSFAKNVVKPLVCSYIEQVENEILELPVSGLSKYEIVPYNTPEAFKDVGFLESLALFSDTPLDEFSFDLNLPDMTDEELVDLVKVGSAATDELIGDWVNRVGPELLQKTYNDVFQIKQNTDPDYSKVVSLRNFFMDKQSGEDYALAIYLLANKLYDNPPADTPHDLDDYNSKIILLRNQAGKRLYNIVQDQLGAIESGKIIKEYRPGTKSVIVYPQVYEDWVNRGGDNDAILGTIVSEKNYYTVAAVDEDIATLKQSWENQKRLEAQAATNNKFTYVKDCLKNNFSRLLATDLNESMTAEEKNTATDIFKEELNMLRADELSDIPAICLRLICRSIFYKTDAERILGSIDKILKENPSMHVREAALIATIELLTDWACSQVTPTSAY